MVGFVNLFRTGVVTSISNLLGALLGFIGVVFFARELGPSEIGVFFLFQAVAGVVSIPADMSVQGSLLKRLSEGREEGQFLSTGFVLISIFTTLTVSGLLLIRSSVNSYLGSDLVILLVIAVVTNEGAKLSKNILQAELRVAEASILELLNKVIFILGGILLLIYNFGVDGLILASISGSLLIILVGVKRTSISLRRPSLNHAKSLFDYGKYGLISFIQSYMFNWLDLLLIGVFLTKSHVGGYEVAWRISTFLMLFSKAVERTIFPQISRWSAESASEKIEAVVPDAVLGSLFLVIPGVFGIAFLSRQILSVIFGSQYAFVWPAFIILAIGKIFDGADYVFRGALLGQDRPELRAKAVTVGLICNIVLNLVLIPKFGLIGAATATAVSEGLLTLLGMIYMSRLMNVKIPYGNLGWCTLSSIVMAAVIYIFKTRVGVTSIVDLSTIISISVFIYISLIFIYPSTRSYCLEQIRQLI